MRIKVVSLAMALVATTAQAGTVITDGADIKLNSRGGLTAASSDGQAALTLGGRVQWDYDATEAPDYGIDSSDLDVRRARVHLQGHYRDWAYKAEMELAESGDRGGSFARSLFIRYIGFGPLANITVGKQKEPFGMMTGGNEIAVLERSAISKLYPYAHAAGIQVQGRGSNWTYGIGLFEAAGDGTNDFADKAITGRVTFAAIQRENRVLHLGAGFTSRDTEIDSDPNTSETMDVYNVELAWTRGPFHGQAEYFGSRARGDFGNLDRGGYYLQAGWIISGENRPYRDGVFKPFKPAAASGAWEVIMRHETGDGHYADIGLGATEGQQTALGANYYANQNVRVGLNYTKGKEDNSGYKGEEVRARIQFIF